MVGGVLNQYNTNRFVSMKASNESYGMSDFTIPAFSPLHEKMNR